VHAVAPRVPDHLIAELLTQVAGATAAADACVLVLERALGEAGLDRGVTVLHGDAGLTFGAAGVPDVMARRYCEAAQDPDSPAFLDFSATVLQPQTTRMLASLLGFEIAVVQPFTDGRGKAVGAVVLDARQPDERSALVSEVFAYCGPALARLLQVQSLQARADKLARQRDLLTSIIDGLTDPVLLTSPDNKMLLANRRAERLFTSAADDSEGRRRAIQINALLFSSSLTRAAIGPTGSAGGGRELNLVDPSDGSDLVFETLTVPAPALLAPEGSVLSILRDITDLKRAVTQLEDQFNRSRVAEHQARRERDQLDAILENVSDPILVTDQQSNIILLNPEADRLFVVEPSQEGEARRAVRSNDTKFTSLISDFLLEMDERRATRMEIADPDAARNFPVEIVSRKILDARGEPTAIVSLVHDLTQAAENERLASELQQLNDELEDRIRRATMELEEHNRRLEWQSFELEKAYRLKSEFLASMSHELRTPINVILGYTSLIREKIYGDLSAQQEDSLSRVYSTSQHLLDLINDILDLSKIEAGKMPVHLEQVPVDGLIAELSETIQPMVRKRGIQYDWEVAGPIPDLQTDRTKLKQILLNLLSNAIKFTHTGAVRVTAELASSGEHVRITVADSGIGIRPEHVDLIFDDFRQIDQSRTREYGGTGLGLSITKKLLTLLGGVIFVESTFGEGSRFTVELPLKTGNLSLEEQVRRAVVDSDKAVLRP
jgi:PAS domain S-box-containing protein